jgi:hypothetical protein
VRNLFLRTFSQGLQAFMPIAVALAWCHASGQPRMAAAIRRGLALAIPVSFAGAWFFRSTTNQALNEAVLAACAVAIAVRFAAWLRSSRARSTETAASKPRAAAFWAIAAAACLIVVRQTMEQLSLLYTAVVELRSLDAMLSLASGALAAGLAALIATAAGRRLRVPVLRRAMWAFLSLFVAQGVLYAFHESAEARLLPWSAVLHAATEPYGPDGIYGIHFSDLLFIVPAAVAAWSAIGPRLRIRHAPDTRLITHQRAATAITLSSCLFMGMQQSDARPPQAAAASRPEELAAMAARPHILFRDTTSGGSFGRLTMAALDAPSGERRSIALTCERLSFAGGRGLCLHLQRGVFNSYTALLLDRNLKPGATIKLQGLPSRTRASSDGRVGAITVFVLGDDYAAAFSTRTTLVDLASGDEIGELEQFSTWRDGARFREVDFNFWGVTFAKDGNTFYAALRTGGKTFLVRGDLALRKLTVMRENVECPAISPDNRLLAYKKRTGPSPDSWRVHVLDLQTDAERVVAAETRYIDDQVEWLDDRHVLYGIPRRTTTMSDVWVASIDGSEAARIFLPQAESPIIVR